METSPPPPADSRSGLFVHAPHAILVHRDGVVIEANPAAARLFGYPDAGQLQGLDLRDFCADVVVRGLFEKRLTSAMSLAVGDCLPTARYRLRSRKGHPVHVRVNTTRDRWNGEIAFVTHYQDETTSVETQQALDESESLLRAVFEASPFAISVSDAETGQLQMVNRAYGEIVGRSVKELLGRRTVDLGLWVGGTSQRSKVLQALRDSGRHVFVSEGYRRADGQVIHIEGGATLFGDPAQPQLLFIGTDVTADRRRQSELEAMMAHAPVAIMVTEGADIRSASPRLAELTGRPGLRHEHVKVTDLWGGDVAYDEIRSEARRQLDANGRVELVRPLTRPDGSTIQLRVQGATLRQENETKRSMVWILSDITAETEAFRAREAAEAASQAKTAFLAMMSHELRTPLNGILGLAELARARDTSTAERREVLNQLADCANSLADILNDILDLSKIEAGRLDINPEAVNLRDLFARLQSTYTPLAEARGLELCVSVAAEVPGTVLVDPVRLRQILANFLGNALKFTPKGQIELRANRTDSDLRLEVRDTGVGISEELLPRLFKPFEQARDTSRSRTAGTGLGLAICHQLAELMQGHVGVEAQPSGGSCFWIQLPLRRPDAQAVARAQAHKTRQVVSLEGVRVLLAEDNEINALITMRALDGAGAIAHRVADGQAAVDEVVAAHADGRPYAVVLMDVQMPRLDGLQATRILRQHAGGAGLRIVALTAGALTEQREECQRAGMDAHLTKPLHRDRLLAEVLRQVEWVRETETLRLPLQA